MSATGPLPELSEIRVKPPPPGPLAAARAVQLGLSGLTCRVNERGSSRPLRPCASTRERERLRLRLREREREREGERGRGRANGCAHALQQEGKTTLDIRTRPGTERAGGWVGERVQIQPKIPFDGPASEIAGRRALALQPWGSAPVGARDRNMEAWRGVCGTGLFRALLKPTRDVLGLSIAR